MNSADKEIYKQFLALSSISKWIGLGGWKFSDPGPTHNTWSLMTSTQQNRKAFIDSLKLFVENWGFEGVDIDWEWPGTVERGGNSGDKQNEVSLLTEMRQALPNKGLSVVLPAQTEYLHNMDQKGLEAQVDFFNVLTYDLHGPWDTTSGIAAHTDLGMINKLLEPL
jgi:GH18 family chitinase